MSPLRETAGGVRSSSTWTCSPRSSAPPTLLHMDSSLHRPYKKSAPAGVAQSHHQLHQTTTMKFLALALLLVVGSQAASLQADAPSQLAQIRSAADVYMTQVKQGLIKALDQLDDTPYQELKTTLTQRVEDLHTNIKALQAQVSPMTDSVVTTISDATAEFRNSISQDIEALRADLAPKREKLREVLEKHMEEYRVQLEPIVKEYQARHTAEMEALRVKMEPVVAELRQKMAANVEETKAALMPIVESVRAKLVERLEQLRQLAVPYVEEYKEQMKNFYSQAQSITAEDIENLKAKITPLSEEIKLKFGEIFGAISATFNKNKN
ncbi:apolipoprotein A-I isoform X2 [Oryzias latipes]|uniref:Apolipoprotein A-Ib n=1 Tax=Oryzias latipes TaxID=8090 RepID=H2MLX9_ORYLA|nr:apolipoprotein A-I isoform X2 [Oryzias latipes]